MVTCELDQEISGEILGWKLPTWQALLLHRVLPSCGGLLVYLTLMCFDFALIYEHYQSGQNGIAIFCIILMLLPALLSLIFTLASPPPGLETETSAFAITLQQKDIKWIVVQFVNFLIFPVAAIGRYCHQIFWWVEAVCACRQEDEGRKRDALLHAKAPSPLELYLFLQAFIHAAPQAVLNILNLMVLYPNSTFDKVSVQAVSIITASLRMASTATVYRRFQREKICGRKYPWGKLGAEETETEDKSKNAETEDTIKETKDMFINNIKGKDEENIYEPLIGEQLPIQQKTNENRKELNSDLIDFSPRSSSFLKTEYSDTSSDYSPQMPDVILGQPMYDSDDEYVRPVSIISRVAPMRRDTQYVIQKVDIPPPPSMPAPRPGSIAVWAEKIVENAESIPTWLSAPPRRKHIEVIQDEPDLPRRVPRSYIRGLEPQDITASLVHYLGWYLFFVARLLSVAAIFNFQVAAATVILFCHYQVMLLFLIIPQASSVKRGFYIFLAFIYLFCLMEFKIRFRHVRVWHTYWFIVCTIETVVFTALWASINNNLHDWWKEYVVTVIYVSLLLSYICLLFYFTVLKPKETIVYISNKQNQV